MRKINAAAAETEFAKVCLKKDGHVNMHTKEHVFINDSWNGTESRVHAFTVSGSKKWTRITDNRALIRGLLDSIGCRYMEGNDAPRHGQTGDYILIQRQDLLDALKHGFGAGEGRRIYAELGARRLTEKQCEFLKAADEDTARLLDAAMRQARAALQSGFRKYFPKEDCVVIFPDEFTEE